MMARTPYVAVFGQTDVLDHIYSDQKLRPAAGRLIHSGRVLLLAANSVLKPAKSGDPQLGVCLSVTNAAAESYSAFQRSLLAGQVMPRHYAVSVPNAATSELCLKFRVSGPAVTLSDDGRGQVDHCPQLTFARDWLDMGVVDQVLIGAMRVDEQVGSQSSCVLMVVDRDGVDRLARAQSNTKPTSDAVTFLGAVAQAAGLSLTRVH